MLTIKSQNKAKTVLLQTEHLVHLDQMHHLEYAAISGPFGDGSHI